MTELEAATLAYHTAALEISRAGLWASYAQTTVAALVGAGQCVLIALGLRQMRRSADHRDHQHEESMTALKALIARTAPAGGAQP